MNVGIVSVWGEQGEGIVSKQYYDLFKQNHTVFVYVRGYQKSFKNDKNYNIYIGSQKTEFKPKAINKKDFKRWIKINKIEILFFNEQQWWPPILWCKDWGIKTVAYIDYYTEETIPLFEAYDMLICNTQKHYKTFKWHPNVKYYKWGTLLELYKPVERDVDVVTFFHSCGFSPSRKGTDLLLKAFYLSNREGKLIIHTQIDLKKIFPELNDLIDELVSQECLSIISKTVSAPGLYYLGDVYLYPSRLEGIGLSIAEAQSSGLFTVVSNIDPMIEFVLNSAYSKVKIDKIYARKDGYFHPQTDIDINDLSNKIDVLSSKPEMIKMLKLRSRSHALKELNFFTNLSGLNSEMEKINFKEISIKTKRLIKLYEINRPLSHKKLVSFYNRRISKYLGFLKFFRFIFDY